MRPLKDRRVLIMGLGRFGGGAGVARFLVERGGRVLITDRCSADQLACSLETLRDLPIDYRLGEHRVEDFAHADLIVVNPAVDRRRNPYLQAARSGGAQITSEIELLLERVHRRRVIGVTGTAGKSTITAMIGHLLAAELGEQRVHIGGNLGGSLLSRVGRITSADWVVLELSSFMLEHLSGFSPHVAVLTNLSENHLDRHGSFAAYLQAKMQIFKDQSPEDHAVLGPDLPESLYAGLRVSPTHAEGYANLPPLSMPGEHNRLNAALALEAVRCAGLAQDEKRTHEWLRNFRGLPHRLELVAERKGVRFFNDSKSTTPASARLAMESFAPQTVHLLLGGDDKGVDLQELARYAARRAAAVYTIGKDGDRIAETAEAEGACSVHRHTDMVPAVREAASKARPGQAVVLSPACSSLDQFENYQQRGTHFAQCVARL